MAIRNDISIDYSISPREILVDAPSVEITIQDLIDTVWDIQSQALAMRYPNILESSGKETLDEVTKVGLTVTLNNAQIAFEARASAPPSGIDSACRSFQEPRSSPSSLARRCRANGPWRPTMRGVCDAIVP